MARIEPTRLCPICAGPMAVRPCAGGVVYACAVCDKPDPIEQIKRWISGELRPPSR